MLLVFSTACVLLSSVALARSMRLTGFDALLGTAVLAVAEIVVVSFGLAAAGAYSAGPLAIACGILAVAGGALYGFRRSSLPPWNRPVWTWRAPTGAVEWVTAGLVALVAVHVVSRAVLAVGLPPYGYDALSYHLAAVGWMVQTGHLPGPETGILVSGYPLGGELLAAWPSVFLRSDVLAALPQVLTALLGGLATVGIARGVGVDRVASIAAGSLFVLTPAVLAQATTAYVDVTTAALALSSVCFLVRWAASDPTQSSRLVLAGLATGAAVGTKWTAGLMAAAGLVAVLVIARRRPLVRTAGAALAYVVPALVVGGGWYGKNLLQYGNPVYPYAIAGLPGPASAADLLTPAPGPSFPEPVPTLWSWARDLLPQLTYTYEERTGGLGTVFTWIGLPCLVLFAWGALRRRNQPAVLLLFTILVPFLLQPYRWWARFTLPMAALAAVSVAAVLSTLTTTTSSRRARRLVLVGTVLAVCATQPALLARTVAPTDGSEPVAAWELFDPPTRDPLWSGPNKAFALRSVAGARTVAVAVNEVGRVGSLFGTGYERTVIPVGYAGQESPETALRGADVLVVCRESRLGVWAASQPDHFRLLSDPQAELAVWRIDEDPSGMAVPDDVDDATVYCT